MRCRALAVSSPMPADAPVMRMTMSRSLPSSPSASTMCCAVGRWSPGPVTGVVQLYDMPGGWTVGSSAIALTQE